MTINDLIVLKRDLDQTKVAHLTNDALRKYLKLSLILNKYNTEFETKRRALAEEAAKSKGYDISSLSPEQDRELINIIFPILNEYLLTEVDVNTKILSWDDLYDGILNIEENNNLSIDVKTRLTDRLCSEEL